MIRLVIFDMDEVLYDYEHPKRLAYLAQLTGLQQEAIHQAIWGSGFEDRAEAGAYKTGADYLEAYSERLGFALTQDQWIEARRVMMRARPDMLALAQRVAALRDVALLTNNGMMLKEALPALAPDVIRIFGHRAYVSAEFGTKKPDPEIYRKAAALCGAAPQDALFVDDKLANVEGAKQAGLHGHHFTQIDGLRDALASHGLAV